MEMLATQAEITRTFHGIEFRTNNRDTGQQYHQQSLGNQQQNQGNQ